MVSSLHADWHQIHGDWHQSPCSLEASQLSQVRDLAPKLSPPVPAAFVWPYCPSETRVLSLLLLWSCKGSGTQRWFSEHRLQADPAKTLGANFGDIPDPRSDGPPCKTALIRSTFSFVDTLIIEGGNKTKKICLAYSKYPRTSGRCLLPSLHTALGWIQEPPQPLV